VHQVGKKKKTTTVQMQLARFCRSATKHIQYNTQRRLQLEMLQKYKQHNQLIKNYKKYNQYEHQKNSLFYTPDFKCRGDYKSFQT